MDKHYDEYYIRSITDMGDSRNVVTNQAIFTNKKIKLVEKGVKVNSSLFDRLVKNKLVPNIDQCLSVENGVTPDSLREYARNLLDSDPGLFPLRNQPDYRDRALRAFFGMPISAPMAFKLTLASCQRPEVYDHSIRVALISLYIAMKSNIHSGQDLAALAAAAVFHDIGILHVSADLLRPGRRLKESERHHLYAHPITGFLILREYPEYHPDISRPVFEHHERLDGSGYPRGLKDEEICFGAQILMLAEVANTVFERGQKSQSLAKLSVLLRLNQKKFNRELSNHLIALVREMQSDLPPEGAPVPSPALEPKLIEVAQVFHDWNETSPKCREMAEALTTIPLLAVIDERVTDLQRMLLVAGFDIDHPAALVEIMRGDVQALGELQILIGETRWQLAEIIHEVRRRWNEIVGPDEAVQAQVLDWLARSEKTLKLA